MIDGELAYAPATELAARIRARGLSPVELMANTLECIEALNPRLNCFCFTYPEEASERAREAEREVMRGGPLGPLHGIPIAFKDLTPTRGKTTTLGSYVYQHWVPDQDAVIVERMRAAGAILVGKTTTPEFAYDGFTHSPLWGETRSPWDPGRTPGGSSGGSAAAVAAGCVPIAEGCDMGGSVRIPAALCGIVGLKPSLGRIPMDLLPSTFDDISHFGPLARSIDDAALFLGIAQGPDDRDILSLPGQPPPPIPVPHEVRGLSLALSMDLGYMATDPDVERCVRDAAGVLREAGARVEEVELGWDDAVSEAALDYWRVFMAAYFGEHLEAWRERMDPAVVGLIEEGRAIRAVDYKRLEIVRTAAWRRLAAVLAEHHALLCPVTTMVAPEIGGSYLDLDQVLEDGRRRSLDMTDGFNLVGQCPALAVPAGLGSGGLPVGIQIVGRRFEEATVLGIGAALEQALGWAGRRAPFGAMSLVDHTPGHPASLTPPGGTREP